MGPLSIGPSGCGMTICDYSMSCSKRVGGLAMLKRAGLFEHHNRRGNDKIIITITCKSATDLQALDGMMISVVFSN